MSIVRVGDLEVEVVKKDIKNIHLGVYPPIGKVRLSAPASSSDDKIRLFILSKIPWIRKNQRKYKTKERQSPREFINKESHFFTGRRYLLNISIDKKNKNTVLLKKTTIELSLKEKYDILKRKIIFESWLRRELKTRLCPFIEKWEMQLGVKVSDWKIKKMKTKWGSCNQQAKRIWFNLELAKVDDYGLDYVVMHELAHLKVRNHGKQFIKILDQNMSDWQQRKQHLNQTLLEFNINPT
jgi:predicted metal-dependent hydrolase